MSVIPVTEVDPSESGKRNRAALRYLHNCAIMRIEPDKHKLERILLGRQDETGESRVPDGDEPEDQGYYREDD